MSDDIEPTAIPTAPNASSPQVSVNVEPSAIPNTPSAPLSSVVQESFKPNNQATFVDNNLSSHIQASDNSEQNNLSK